MQPLGDATTAAVEYALQGLTQRADVTANNIANLNTPGFRAGRVDFESVLSGALASGDAPTGPAAVLPGMGLPDATGNTVDLETEMVAMMKDNLLRDAMVNSFNYKATLMRTAINGR